MERRLRELLDIPVFHDDQHGTAIVVLAALTNALQVLGKSITDIRIVVSGVGAAGNAIIRLLRAQGAAHIIGCDRGGAVHADRAETDEFRRWIAENTNTERRQGSLAHMLAGADVFIGVSAPDLLTGEDIATMADGAIVFALANPDPEVDPIQAGRHAAVVAPGRSDYPNQINNVLAFPVFSAACLTPGRTRSPTSACWPPPPRSPRRCRPRNGSRPHNRPRCARRPHRRLGGPCRCPSSWPRAAAGWTSSYSSPDRPARRSVTGYRWTWET